MKNLDIIGRITAGLSFVLGTLILIAYLYLKTNIILIGFGYLIIAILINVLVFLTLLVVAFINNERRLELIKTCGLMLINIPIAVLYAYLVISLEYRI